MAKRKRKLDRVMRGSTEEEKLKDQVVREQIMAEVPKRKHMGGAYVSPIAAAIKAAREAKGMSWYAVAKAAGIPNSGTVRDIERGQDAQISNVEKIAAVLGLQLELRDAS